MRLDWDWEIARRSMGPILKGLWVTVLGTAGGMSLALALGLVFALLRRSRVWVVSKLTGLVVEFVRSTPLLIQLFMVYFLVPDIGWNGPLLVGVFVLGMHYSTYTSEVYRSGIEGVARGQWEAGIALNMSRGLMWRRVVLPQAIPPIVPAMGNYVVAMFKDTPLLYAITVREMLGQANNFNSRVGSYVESYTIVGVVFLILSLGAAGLIRWCEKRFVVRHG